MKREFLQKQLAIVNVRAFLKAIRLGEGTLDDRGYHRMVGGEEFEDFSHHPNKRVYVPRYKVWSTAAGAYQFIHRTWRSVVELYDLPDFSPECQDEGAVALIEGRGALHNVIRGEFEEAIEKCSLEWASLPGHIDTDGQREASFNDVKAVYLDNGGTLAPGQRP